jgi:lipopolysaccharide export system ATP-binding protein
MTLLQAKHLIKRYNNRPVLNGLSFDIEPGEIVGLLGPNGAGKTTAFYITIGLVQPDSGHILFKSQDITSTPIHKRAQLGFGYLAQEPSIFRSLSVEDNIRCILETLPNPPADALTLLDELHLTHLRDKKASTLSGGERRRLEITRALVTQPSLLLLDEPFANIDPLAVADVKHLIRLLKQKNISVLITDHNAREIFSIVDRAYLVQDGAVLLSGTPDTLINDPQARRTYLGEDFRL